MSENQQQPSALAALVQRAGNEIAKVAGPALEAIEQSPLYAAAVNTKDAVMDSKFMDGQAGMATLAGYGRGGLKDLQDVVLNAFPDSQKQHEEMGMIATPTPGMVDRSFGRDGPGNEIEQERER